MFPLWPQTQLHLGLRSGDAFEHFPCCASARSALVRAWHRILELNYCVRKGFVETSIPCHVVPVGLQNMAFDIGGKRLQVEPLVPAVPAVQAWTSHALVCREVSTQAGCSQVLQLPELRGFMTKHVEANPEPLLRALMQHAVCESVPLQLSYATPADSKSHVSKLKLCIPASSSRKQPLLSRKPAGLITRRKHALDNSSRSSKQPSQIRARLLSLRIDASKAKPRPWHPTNTVLAVWQSENLATVTLKRHHYSRTMPKDRAEEVSRGSFVFVLQSGD